MPYPAGPIQIVVSLTGSRLANSLPELNPQVALSSIAKAPAVTQVELNCQALGHLTIQSGNELNRGSDPHPAKPVRVVIVDNDPAVRTALQLLLRQLGGYNIVGAFADGNLALAQLPELRPELVFTDIIRPGLVGFEFTRRLKDLVPGTAVIILTAVRDVAAVIAAESLGAAAFLVKPVSLADLKAALEAVRKGVFHLSDQKLLSLPAPNPFLDLSWVFPAFLTVRAFEKWELKKNEPNFWPNLAVWAQFRPRALANHYGLSLRRTESEWRLIFGHPLRLWLDHIQVARVLELQNMM